MIQRLRSGIAAALLSGAATLPAQTLDLETRCNLPSTLPESSGLTTLNGGQTWWTHNDGGNGAFLYELDTNCQVIRTLTLQDAPNKDWEDLTHDDQGRLYIGDFGNNENDRTNLRIFIVPNPDSLAGDSVVPGKITFQYADQPGFPPAADRLHYDMEAMVWLQDTLHLFSKNRTQPFSGYTRHYKLPAIPGDYSISPSDSFLTGTGSNLQYWITGAALSPEGRILALMSSDRLWTFTGYSGSAFFKGQVQAWTLSGSYTQKEAVAFQDSVTLAFTDEKLFGTGGKLYKAVLPVTTGIPAGIYLRMFPNPADDSVIIQHPDQATIQLFAPSGHRLYETFRPVRGELTLDVSSLPRGVYLVRVNNKSARLLIRHP
ncbi:MAG: T9SS type A sorting domain-containing protein [Bacteroidia bacterium]|nr:T9SS type A sorting domain-containing protein [Bacteroidia bacterium]